MPLISNNFNELGFRVCLMKNLRDANIPGISVIRIIIVGCMVVVLISLSMTHIPKAVGYCCSVLFDLCVLYMSVYLGVSGKGRKYLNQIIVLMIIAVGITWLSFYNPGRKKTDSDPDFYGAAVCFNRLQEVIPCSRLS